MVVGIMVPALPGKYQRRQVCCRCSRPPSAGAALTPEPALAADHSQHLDALPRGAELACGQGPGAGILCDRLHRCGWVDTRHATFLWTKLQ
jgi:hypothetical protein